MKPKQNISIFLPSMNTGGAETVAANLCNQLTDYFNVNLVVISGDISFKLHPSVKIWQLFQKENKNSILQKLLIPLVAYRYYRLCKKMKVVSSLSFLPQANFSNAFGKYYGAPYKIILSQRTNESAYINMLSPLKKQIQRFFVKKLYCKADIINANSHHALLDLTTNFGLKNATSVIYNPLSPIPGTSNVPAEMALSSQQFKLLYVANFRKEKNHKMLLKALSLLPFKTNVILFLIGSGDTSAEKEFIKANNLEESVKILGYIDKPFDYVKAADCCVLASDFEGFSNALLEAMACSKPVISTATSGGIEMLNPANTTLSVSGVYKAQYGLLTEVGSAEQMNSAIALLYNDVNLRNYYSSAVAARIADFDPAVITAQFIELIRPD